MIPARFKTLCKSTGLPQSELARTLGIEASQLNRWCTGKSSRTGCTTKPPRCAVVSVVVVKLMLDMGMTTTEIRDKMNQVLTSLDES
jgi:hypothetical protein